MTLCRCCIPLVAHVPIFWSQRNHISHSAFWIERSHPGDAATATADATRQPSSFTTITHKDVKDGKYLPVDRDLTVKDVILFTCFSYIRHTHWWSLLQLLKLLCLMLCSAFVGILLALHSITGSSEPFHTHDLPWALSGEAYTRHVFISLYTHVSCDEWGAHTTPLIHYYFVMSYRLVSQMHICSKREQDSFNPHHIHPLSLMHNKADSSMILLELHAIDWIWRACRCGKHPSRCQRLEHTQL